MRSNKNNTTGYDGTVAPARPSLLQRLLRLLQFLSAFTSLILFSVRLAKIIRLTKRASHSNGAVEGILAAAVLYTLVSMVVSFFVKGVGSTKLRMLFIVLDVLFVGAFIAVAVLTSPARHGSSGPCSKPVYYTFLQDHVSRHPSKVNCNLPWGTFMLAILSTLLHAATAAYHAIKDRRRATQVNAVAGKEAHDNSVHQAAVPGDGVARANGDGYGGAHHA